MYVLKNAQRVVDELSMDFRQFTMPQFIMRIEQVKGRKILLLPIPLPLHVDGAWVSDAERPHEYIFYDLNLPPIQQIHTQLHEIGHFLSGHKTLQVTSENLPELILAVKHQTMSSTLTGLLMRSVTDGEAEDEAEAVATIIQSRVIRASRISELSMRASDHVTRFLHDMGLS